MTEADFETLWATLEARVYTHHTGRQWVDLTPGDSQGLDEYLVKAHAVAVEKARALGFAERFLPAYEAGGLRLNKYPPGVGFKVHTDDSLITCALYRSQWDTVDGDVVIGQLAEIAEPALKEQWHAVRPADTEQRSIVYFACPAYDTVFRTGQTMRELKGL